MDEIELKKSTVAQLKLMCKEKKITGYSKLGKSCIIEKLVNWQRSQVAASNNLGLQSDVRVIINNDASSFQPLATDTSTPDTSLLSTLPVDSNSFIACTNSSAITFSATGTQDNYGSKAVLPLPMDTEPQQPAKNTALILNNVQSSSSLAKTDKMLLGPNKRPFDGEEDPFNLKKTKKTKKTRIDPELQSSATPAFKVPGLSERAKLMLPPPNYSKRDEPRSSDTLKEPRLPSKSSNSSLKSGPAISASKPFKALVSQKITWDQPSSTHGDSDTLSNKENLLVSSISESLDFSHEKVVELGPITLAPSVLHRKRASNLALIFSGILIQDLVACTQVSRLFRYSGKILLQFILSLVGRSDGLLSISLCCLSALPALSRFAPGSHTGTFFSSNDQFLAISSPART